MPSQAPARRVSTPPLPASFLALQIVQAAAKPSATVQELAGLCQNDPGFVARALAYVNSAGVSLNRRVTSVQHAVSLLGIRGTRNLALGMCVLELTPHGSEGGVLLGVCLRRAVIAKQLAEKLERPNPDDYFTLGMLLEIGLLVKARRDLAGAARMAGAAASTRITLERAAGEEDHAALGARLARTWQLGDAITDALLYHHDRAPRSAPMASVAWLTESIASVFESADAMRTRVLALEAGAQLHVPADLVDWVLRKTPEAIADSAREFGRDIGPQVDVETLLRNTEETIGELNRNYAEVVGKLEALVDERESLLRELRRADERLSAHALTDDVSGLPNQRAFRDALTRDLARAERANTYIALLVLDLDQFHEVNELHGPSAADAVLAGVAEELLHCVRVSDVLARVSGATFAMLLPNTNLPGAMVVAERARQRVQARDFMGPHGVFQVTVSVGVAIAAGAESRGKEAALLAAAESGVEQAKRAGRNRVVVGSI